MDELFVLAIIALGVSIPLAAIFTAHQRKMAAILHAQRNHALASESEARVLNELAELRQVVHEQAILLDDLSSMHRRLLDRTEGDQAVRDRISSS